MTPPSVARSGKPSSLKSPTAMGPGSTFSLTGFGGATNVPSPWPRKISTPGIETLFCPLVTTARSALPSPLKSAAKIYWFRTPATFSGQSEVGSGVKVPSPLPRSIETPTPEPVVVTARSGIPSPLKSATATPKAATALTLDFVNVPSPLPRRIITPSVFGIIRSRLPSWLKSATPKE